MLAFSECQEAPTLAFCQSLLLRDNGGRSDISAQGVSTSSSILGNRTFDPGYVLEDTAQLNGSSLPNYLSCTWRNLVLISADIQPREYTSKGRNPLNTSFNEYSNCIAKVLTLLSFQSRTRTTGR
jgi:hypothetical protein